MCVTRVECVQNGCVTLTFVQPSCGVRANCRGRSLEVFAARAAVGEALAAAGGAEDLAHDARVRRGAEGLLLRDYTCASVLCIF